MPTSALPLPAKSTSGTNNAVWEAVLIIPFLMCGGNLWAKFLGAMIGTAAWRLGCYCLKNTESRGTRLAGVTVFLALGFGAFVMACDVLELPMRNSSGGLSVAGNHSVAGAIAQIRAEVEKRKPGFFTEEDHKAAAFAIEHSDSRDMMTMAIIYREVLKARLEER